MHMNLHTHINPQAAISKALLVKQNKVILTDVRPSHILCPKPALFIACQLTLTSRGRQCSRMVSHVESHMGGGSHRESLPTDPHLPWQAVQQDGELVAAQLMRVCGACGQRQHRVPSILGRPLQLGQHDAHLRDDGVICG